MYNSQQQSKDKNKVTFTIKIIYEMTQSTKSEQNFFLQFTQHKLQ